MDGILLIDKPAGPTSHDVVYHIRKALGEKKVGHTGTLDPTATGVLPLVLGRDTKLARYFSGGDKVYCATVCLGISTSTLDAAGEVTCERPVNVTVDQLNEVLEKFRGDIEQIPPMYSAKKQEGKRLYQLARQGLEVERQPKKVSIKSLTLDATALPEFTLTVHCTAGTYVRVLAHDIGEALGCGGHLKSLRRTAAGPFLLENSITLDAAVQDPAKARSMLIPAARALICLPRIDVPAYLARMISSGYQLRVSDLSKLDAPDFASDQAIALGLDGGELIAVARSELASTDLAQSLRDALALKTERLLAA